MPFNQATLMDRQAVIVCRVRAVSVGKTFDGEIVCDQDRNSAVGDESQQPVVTAVKHCERMVQDVGIGPARHVDERRAIAGMEAQHVAGLFGSMGLMAAHSKSLS